MKNLRTLRKRALPLLLALVMCLSFLPGTAGAASSPTQGDLVMDVGESAIHLSQPALAFYCQNCGTYLTQALMDQYGDMYGGADDASVAKATSQSYYNNTTIQTKIKGLKGGTTVYTIEGSVKIIHSGVATCPICGQGWRTDANGWYNYSDSWNVTVYDTFTLNYNANGGTGGGTKTERAAQEYYTFSNIPTPTHPDGKEFLGWSTDPSAKTADSNALQVGPSPNATTKTVYAVWGEEKASYKVVHEYFVDNQKVSSTQNTVKDVKVGTVITGESLKKQNPTYSLDGKTLSFAYTSSNPVSITAGTEETITLRYDHQHKDSNSDGKCDECGKCNHEKDPSTNYCKDPNCTHDSSCTCGGKDNTPHCPHPENTTDHHCADCWENGTKKSTCDNTHCKAPGCVDDDDDLKCDVCGKDHGTCSHTPGACVDSSTCKHPADCPCRKPVPTTKNTFSLTYDAKGGTVKDQPTYTETVETDQNWYVFDNLVPVRDGYKFLGWDNGIIASIQNPEVTTTAKWACDGNHHDGGDGICDKDGCGACTHDPNGCGPECNHDDDCQCKHTHADGNGDGICDGTGCNHCMHNHAEGECPEHWNGDTQLCDNPSCLKPAHKHVDKEPEDGKCDSCGECIHTPNGCGPECDHDDDCQCKHQHKDDNTDGKCDVCGKCLHPKDDDGYCTVDGCKHGTDCCVKKPTHQHADNNGDGICDGEGCNHCMHNHAGVTECPSHWTADGKKLCDNPYCVETNKGDPVLTITNSYGNITVSNGVATVPYTVTVKKIGGNRAYGLGIRDTLTPTVYLRDTRTPVNHAEVTVTDIQVTVNGGSPKTLEAASGNTINEANARGWWTVIDPSVELKDGDTAVLTYNVHIRNTGSDAIDYYLSNYAEYGFNKSLPEKQQTLSLRFGGAAMALNDGGWEITGGSNVTTDPEAPSTPSSGNGSSTGTSGSLDGNQPPHTHSYTWRETTAPTCTEGGTETGTCSCGDTTTRGTSALGHNMGAWYSSGTNQERRDCSRCDYYETRSVTDPTPTPTPTPTPDPTPIPDDPTPLDPGTTIDDQEVPLAGTVGLNNTDHFAYIIGYDEDHVRPMDNITRAEAVTIFFRLMTEDYRAANWSTENSFSDVNAGSWFNNAISTVQKAGALEHFAQDEKFLPNQAITRAEFASIAAGFVSDEITGEDVGDFSDTEGHWAAEAIRKAVEAGWITGVGGNRFAPDETITRAEVMAIINRMLDRTPDKDHMLPEMKKWIDNTEDKWYYADVQEATNEHDYERDESSVETWTALKKGTDWAALELGWAANGGASAPEAEPETQGLPDGI